MKRIYNVLVKNQSGVLCKVSGLFWRRCFNIDSLAVGETEDTAISNMTIVSTGDDHTQEQIEKQLNKKIDVIKVKTFDEKEAVCRENRRDIIDNCAVMNATIIDMGNNMMTIQICDTPERAQIFLDSINHIKIVEITRSGTVALTKCKEG